MKAPIIITEPEFHKCKNYFTSLSDQFEWIVTSSKESFLADRIKNSNARVAVLGIDKYTGPIYEALSGNAKDNPALIARYGVGHDGIDPELCRKNNILLSITKETLDRSVAEHSISLLFALAKNTAKNDKTARSGLWEGNKSYELFNKKIGIAGFGKIGRITASIASQGLGMKVVVFDTTSLPK